MCSTLNKIDNKNYLFRFYIRHHSLPVLYSDGQTDGVNALCITGSLCNICLQNLESYGMA